MASLHVLDATPQEGRAKYRVAVHVPIPNTNNSVGVNWRTALINSGIGGTTVLKSGDGTAGTISATEAANVASGALYEQVETIEVDTAGSVNAFLDAVIADVTTRTQARLQAALKYFGYTR